LGNRNGDMVLPSGGGGWTFVLAKNFEDVNQLTKYEKNREMNETEVNPHYYFVRASPFMRLALCRYKASNFAVILLYYKELATQ